MDDLLVIVILIGISALLAAGCAFMFHVLKRQLDWKRRAFLSTLVAALVPTLFLILVVAFETEFGAEFFIVTAVMMVWAVLMATAVCFPIAYFLTRRWERAAPVDQ